VANYLRLLRLPEAIIDDLKKQTMSFGHGKALLALEDTELRLRARKEIIENSLSVRDTESLVERLKRGATHPSTETQPAEPLTPIQARMKNMAQDLSKQYSIKVEVKGSERRGKIVLNYTSRQELERVLEMLQN
jgi:ParB family chromosome partitioning protein